MLSMEWGLFTSIFLTLALVQRSAASDFYSTPEEDEPASVPSLSTKVTDLILVSFKKPWNEAHTSFARLLGGPITTWRIPSKILDSYVVRSITQYRKPVLVAADPGESFEAIQKIPQKLRSACLTWLFVRHYSQIRNHITNSWPNLTTCGEVGVLGMNSTVIQSIFWQHDLSADSNPGSKEMLAKLRIPHRANVNGFGQQLTVACIKIRFYWGNDNYCDLEAEVKNILALLIAKNITIKRQDLFLGDIRKELALPNGWEIALHAIPLRHHTLLLFDIPLFFIDYDVFYSRVDCHHVITFLAAAGESWKLVVTTIFLLALVVVVSVAVGEKGWSIVRRSSDTVMFLLAAVLATSAVEPNVVRLMAVPRKALLGLWLLAILPLSVYFRSELTSMLTLKRPAYRIDTLQKLEHALHRNEVAPCVLSSSPQHRDLEQKVNYVNQRSLMKKLQSAFAKHGDEALAKKTTSACLQCALRRDRICLSRSNLRSPFLNKCPNVRAFVEPFKMELRGYYIIKFHELYKPLRRLLLATREQRLIARDEEEYDYGDADNQFDVSGLFTLLVILHAASCLVLLLELLVARYLRGHMSEQ